MTEEEVISMIRTEIMDPIGDYEHPSLAIIAMHEILTEFAWANYEHYTEEEHERMRDPIKENNHPIDMQIVYNIIPRPL